MPRHDIELNVPAQVVHNTDVEVRVRSDDKPLGRVQISKGSIDWLPSPNSRKRYRLTWERFDELMKKNGREVL